MNLFIGYMFKSKELLDGEGLHALLVVPGGYSNRDLNFMAVK